MKKKLSGLLLSICLSYTLSGQTDYSDRYRDFPLVFTIQFHSLSLPFRDIMSNFANIGFGIGTEFSLNKRSNLLQQFQISWYRNRAVGNGLLCYTQTAWRPQVASSLEVEWKAGVGYLLASRPVRSYKPVGGDWIAVGRRGKGMFTVPVGAAITYNHYVSQSYLAPFAGYQFLLVSGYNQSVPVVPETLLQFGTRRHW